MCSFDGVRAVRFGDGQNYTVAIYENSVLCNAASFQVPGQTGHCEYNQIEAKKTQPKALQSFEFQPLEPVTPPSNGTVYLDPDIIRTGDPSSFKSLRYTGTVERSAYHSEYSTTRSYSAYNYELTFDDGDTLNVSVDKNVGSESAGRTEVDKLAIPIGQAPAVLRQQIDVITVWAGDGRGTANRLGGVSTYVQGNTDLVNGGYLEEFLVLPRILKCPNTR